jgi:hypothetical protein
MMIHTGTIMEIRDNKAYVFTQSCDMVQIRAKKEYLMGQQVHFSDKDMLKLPAILRLRNYRLTAAAAVALLLIASIIISVAVLPRGAFGFDTACAAVVSVDINPSIELSVNKEMRVIDIVYANEAGSLLSDGLNVRSKSISEALTMILELAGENGYLAEGHIVLVSAAPNSPEPDQTYEKQLRGILSSFEQDAGPDVFTVYVEDTQIIRQAKQTDLSIGKLLLYKYAVDNGYDISVQKIKETGISDILGMLDIEAADVINAESAEAVVSTEPLQTPEPSPTPEASPSPSPAPSPTPSPEPSTSPTPSGFSPKLSASVSGDKLKFTWTPATGAAMKYNGTAYEGFKYYKVVASDSDPTPIYPENGYIHVASELGTSNWSVEPSKESYNKSPALESGKTYYFAVTYVFKNGSFTSNTVSLTVPEYAEKPSVTAPVMSDPQLSVSVSGETLYFNWTPLPDSTVAYNGTTYKNFSYAKIVASADDPTPVYPDNGYLYYASDPGASAWSVTPAQGNYNKSPQLEPGKTYYFAVTYVFDNGKFVSGTVTATVPGYTEPAVPSMSEASLSVSYSGGLLHFSWTALPDSTVDYMGTWYKNFAYYKVVASETNPHPVYPDDGYLTYQSGLLENTWSTDPSSAGLESGKTYYFAITYVFDNGKFVTNTVTYTIP